MQIEPETVVRVSPEQISCDVGEEAVLLQLQRGQYYGLNKIGAQIWKLLQKGPTSVAALQKDLCDRYEVESAEAARDLEALLRGMEEAGLIEIAK
ncbi:MAG TPA: PqqD family protein [Terriglobales bacterium]|nr:PqqD family protein [Terriglobales bacterium]